jgi:hypothetical protein
MEEEAPTLDRENFDCSAFGFFRNNPDGHELGMRTGPRQRCLFSLKKTIDDKCVSLRSGSTASPGGAAIDDVGPGVDGYAGSIGEEDLGAERNFPGVDGTMPFMQPRTIPAGAVARPGSSPIDGDARQDGLFHRLSVARTDKSQAGNHINKILHNGKETAPPWRKLQSTPRNRAEKKQRRGVPTPDSQALRPMDAAAQTIS